MTPSACSLPLAAHYQAPASLATCPVRISEHRWSPEFAEQLSSWAASTTTLVVLPGGMAMLGGPASPAPFANHVMSAWLAAHRRSASDVPSTRSPSCTVLRFGTGSGAMPVQQLLGTAVLPAGVTTCPDDLVQLRPAAFLRFLFQRQASALDPAGHAQDAARESVGLLRHVLFGAWPCGHSRLGTIPGQSRRRTLAFDAQAVMSRSLACRHPLDELSRRLDTSPFHLAHVFRSEIGISVHRYLVHLRLIAAIERLGEGEPDLSKLALDLGFSHHSHFSSLFRRIVGYSPRDVRRMLTAESPAALGIVREVQVR